MPGPIDWNNTEEIENHLKILRKVLQNKSPDNPDWQDAYIRAMQNLQALMGFQLEAWRFTQSEPR